MPATRPSTRITIHGWVTSGHKHNRSGSTRSTASSRRKETALLTLHPRTHVLASEWLDGLLMLLNQQPITAETQKLLNLVAGYGLKIRLLNVRFEEGCREKAAVPGREGVDDGYYYDVFGGA
jgi:engulfment/cell motility protein 1